ncbi:hypothetical protein V7O62_09905 [Methanolobus sp. ZRKC2]|uniref:hypothetical protein n=1 Tax=Methanolobus sp. ZRKC2 TaxID=3125783 RepID=UPI0032437DE4
MKRKLKSKIVSKKCPDCGVLIHVHVDNKEIKCSGCKIVWDVICRYDSLELYCKPGKRARPNDGTLALWGVSC